jgi:hypothetical protein
VTQGIYGLQDRDVVSMDSQKNLGEGETSRIAEIRKKIRDKFYGAQQGWINDGVECELLREGSRWQKGKILLRLEFIPDEPAQESQLLLPESLDDLRAELSITNS